MPFLPICRDTSSEEALPIEDGYVVRCVFRDGACSLDSGHFTGTTSKKGIFRRQSASNNLGENQYGCSGKIRTKGSGAKICGVIADCSGGLWHLCGQRWQAP